MRFRDYILDVTKRDVISRRKDLEDYTSLKDLDLAERTVVLNLSGIHSASHD